MSSILDGKAVARALTEELKERTAALKNNGVLPTLATVRVGERGDDIAYERGAGNRCRKIGIEVRNIVLPADITLEKLLAEIDKINKDPSIHGCLIFMPLPKHLDENAVRNALSPRKDIDGITPASQAGVFTGRPVGFPPCTPSACMQILKHYNIDLKGKNAVVFGRSLVVGRPLAMMLLNKNATVTICHTKTVDAPSIAASADILCAAVGHAGTVTEDFVNDRQILLDVGINVNEEGKLCGDATPGAKEKCAYATPVPGGVGSVTTSVLASHVIEAAEQTL